MIDTHTHLYMAEYDVDGQAEGSLEGQCAAVDRAVAAGVDMMVLPNVDRASMAPLKALHAARPDNTLMAMGLHPTEVKEDWQTELAFIEQDIRAGRYSAVGEVGIDLYWDKAFEREQMQAFDRQLSVASELGLPVIIHCREGLDRVLEVMQGHRGVGAVFHSFGGAVGDVERICSVGDYYFGINGIVTFKNSTLRDVLPAIPRERILTETDAPFLAPVPFRGKRNESAMIAYVVEAVAHSLSIPSREADMLTAANARRFFNIE